jgi:endoglucanase
VFPTVSARRLVPIAATIGAAAIVTAVVSLGGTPASAGSISGVLYRDPNSAVVRWVAANPNDSRMPVIRDKVASQPAAHWLSSFNPSTVQSEVSSYLSGANAAGQLPLLSVYEIPNRDCGGASAGGAPDVNQYQTWVSNFSHGLGSQTVIVVLETDSIALQTCLSANDLAARNQALTTAVQTIKAGNPNAKVYLDGGHSAWNPASDQANRLRAAGVQFADGFFTNVSNFNSTANEAAYGRSIISALNGFGISGKHQIIDTSRNGGAAGDWCADDNTDRRIGQYPTTNTGDANIDGFLWVKPPGEADGCAFTAGSFQPQLAFSLAENAPFPSPTATTASPRPSSPAPSSASPSSSSASPSRSSASPSSSTTTTTTPPRGACTVAYQVTNSWQGGFQANVTVTAGATAINGWTVTWTFTGGQVIQSLWNGTFTPSGPNVTVKDVGWNGALSPGGTAQFGFTANGNSSPVPAVSCASP